MKSKEALVEKSQRICDLVQRVRKGVLKKEELFKKLANLDTDASREIGDQEAIFHFSAKLDLSPDEKSRARKMENTERIISYDDQRLNFRDRAVLWHERKQRLLKQHLIDKEKKELDQCTFRPSLTSRRSMSQIPSSKQNPWKPPIQDAARPPSAQSAGIRASLRLYKDHGNNQKQKLRVAQELKMREIQKEEEECTFQPQLLPSSKKFITLHGVNLATKAKPDQNDDFEARSSFHPKTNKIKGDMYSVRQYLRQNVVERLSQVAETRKQQQMNFMNDKNNLQRNSVRDAKSFETFLWRQENSLLRKKSKVDSFIRKEKEETERPKMNLQSARMAKKSKFLEPKKTIDPSVLYPQMKPKITNKAKRMRPKTADEMSTNSGCAERWKYRKEQLKMDADFQNLREATFRPNVNHLKRFERVSSKIKTLINDTKPMCEVVKKLNQEKEARRLAYRQLQTLDELKECTFHPVVKDPPFYLQKIFSSLHRGKTAFEIKREIIGKQHESYGKPDWK